MTIVDDGIKRKLSDLYSHGSRHYHNLEHVKSLLALLEKNRDLVADVMVVEATIWFHDAIYDSRAKDNESKSAALAAELLKNSDIGPEQLSRIQAMIEATAKHEVPDFADADAVADAKLFLDMDLSILGVDEATFDSYEAAVRREYDWVDDEAWRSGRAGVLARFLARERIYFSDIFWRDYEGPARRNIGRSLARLGH